MAKYMDLKEFRDRGYLMELNRQFLHPLGLALEMDDGGETGKVILTGIRDSRDDPEGMIFSEDMIDIEDAFKASRIEDERRQKEWVRRKSLGYDIQPLDSPERIDSPPDQSFARENLQWFLATIMQSAADPGKQIEWLDGNISNGLRDITEPGDTFTRRELDGTKELKLTVMFGPKESAS